MPRNSNIGDANYRLDLRVARDFHDTEHLILEIVGEGFNIFARRFRLCVSGSNTDHFNSIFISIFKENAYEIFCVFCLLAFVASAQTKPDFSGTWKQNDSKSTVRPGSTLKYSNEIEHQDPKLTIITMLEGGDRPASTYSRSYTTDGKPNESSDREGDKFTTTVKWEGNTLVFETTEKEKTRTLGTRETWTLSDDGKTLTKKRHSSGPRGDFDQTFVLERQ